MALHRDIFWIGRQWAVTGSGIQAVDQRLKGAFDIDRAAVWKDGLIESLRDQTWFNAADFEKALGVARGRFPAEPPTTAAAPAPSSAKAVDASAVPNVSLRLDARGKLARFLPQWRIRP
ncbi:hypothetical protein HL667_02230 [Bradyrhizobium sp. 83012]|uniref:Uncharacterized protein n=1 Tax=Bradyrhizobium aeschynomenes TaxID=2734909 RepID=A0ABX2C7R3_9BRAD|nr:hypothetical protein [Bradyrhizobium aeschynomenes]NPU12967.1 hypothetical protein [Bradyrhizobium aeschynomenes]NPU63808.1 hypothetical protein [Bradyrhizobium aeschynomenes]NPV23289.1 hypothetical protein [Bradyrhizobium aeschynomenes]